MALGEHELCYTQTLVHHNEEEGAKKKNCNDTKAIRAIRPPSRHITSWIVKYSGRICCPCGVCTTWVLVWRCFCAVSMQCISFLPTIFLDGSSLAFWRNWHTAPAVIWALAKLIFKPENVRSHWRYVVKQMCHAYCCGCHNATCEAIVVNHAAAVREYIARRGACTLYTNTVSYVCMRVWWQWCRFSWLWGLVCAKRIARLLEQKLVKLPRHIRIAEEY